MIGDVLDTTWGPKSRERQGRLITLATLCAVTLVTITWGFDQADADLRSENPTIATVEAAQ